MTEAERLLKKMEGRKKSLVPRHPSVCASTNPGGAAGLELERPHEWQFQQDSTAGRTSGSRKRMKKDKVTPKWESAAKSLLDRVPKAQDWDRHMEEIGRPDVAGLESTVNAPIGRPYRDLTGKKAVHSRASMVATRTASLLQNATIAKSPFGRLLIIFFLSYCAALESTGLISLDSLNALMREALSEANDWYLARLRKGAIWANSLIYKLSIVGWTVSRATSGFSLYGPATYQYADLCCDSSKDYIVERLSTTEYVTYQPKADYPGRGLFVPQIVTDWEPTFNLKEVSKALGYPQIDALSASPQGVIQSPETTILPLFHAMGGMIPEVILDCTANPQTERIKTLESYEDTVHEISLHAGIRHILSDKARSSEALEKLLSLSKLKVQEPAYDEGCRIYHVMPFQLHHDWLLAYWTYQAFELWCFVFPRVCGCSSRSTRGAMLEILQRISQACSNKSWDMQHNAYFTRALLLASRFGTLSHRQHLLDLVTSSQKKVSSVFLQAEIAHQQSVLLRLKGDIHGSEGAIRNFLSSHSNDIPQSHYLIGNLRISQAKNQAYRFDFVRSHEESHKWQPPPDASQLHGDVVWNQVYHAGQTLRGQGYFDEALKCFEICYEDPGLRAGKRRLVMASLTDLRCELEYAQRCLGKRITTSLDDARGVVEPEIEQLREHGRDLKGFRRLLLSLIEIEIRTEHPDNARRLLEEILPIYERLPEPDVVDRLGHVRAFISWARLSPSSQAERYWFRVLRQNQAYNPSEAEVFTCGVVHLYISSTRLQNGDYNGARSAWLQAQEILQKNVRQFLIPGVGTYLLEFVQRDLQPVFGAVNR